MRKKNKNSWIIQSIGILISVGCISFIVRQVNLEELKSALLHFDWIYLTIGMASLAAGYMLRIIRWGVMLRAAGAKVHNIDCAGPFLGSITLNNVLPFRAGDLVRAFVFPASMGVSVATSTASLFLERLLDLLTLLLCLAAGVCFSIKVSLPSSIKSTVFGLAIFVFIAFFSMFLFNAGILSMFQRLTKIAARRNYHKIQKVFSFITEFFKRLTEMLGTQKLFFVFCLSLCVWVFEAGLFMSILEGLHLSVTIIDALGIMAITTLATLVPSSPGYVGPFHLVAYSALVALGISLSDAASFAIVTHLALWLPTTLAGAIAILCNKKLFQGLDIQEQGV